MISHGKLLLASAIAATVHAVPYVESEGSNFIVQGSGNRFDIIGLE
jgi:hypothetical protein